MKQYLRKTQSDLLKIYLKCSFTDRQRFSRFSVILGFLFLSRLIAMVAIPLNDSTEARYGEIARKMLATGDWITLWHDMGIPFWGKPPLAIWLSALSMKFFGVSAFVARLPALFLSMGVLYVLWQGMCVEHGKERARTAVLVLASSFLFFLCAGTMMTDTALLFAVFLSQLSFWRVMSYARSVYAYLFFIGLGLGLLAKGPIALIFIGVPLVVWTIWMQALPTVWQRLPWIKGTFLTVLIALPWYVLAEIKTPGFLQYFIVGEHLGRFMTSSWQGDKYGFAHAHTHGMIWIYALAAVLPWTVCLGWVHIPMVRANKSERSWLIYWGTCLLTPLLLFSFASNIIYPYVLPSLPAFAILFSVGLKDKYREYRLYSASLLTGCFMLLASAMFFYWPQYLAHSEDRAVRLWQQQGATANPLLIWHHKVPFSAQFYARGRVMATMNLSDLCSKVDCKQPVYLLIDRTRLEELPTTWRFEKVGEVNYYDHSMLLFSALASLNPHLD